MKKTKKMKKSLQGRKTRKGRRRRKSKYVKTYIEMWKCNDCDFEWTYKTMRCPICSSMQITKII